MDLLYFPYPCEDCLDSYLRRVSLNYEMLIELGVLQDL